LSRASTSFFSAASKTWMVGTRPGHDELNAGRKH
jgi:hypothetical protein